jgi:hypothetical protein
MDSIIISLIPTAFMLALGAIIYFTDPAVRADRKRIKR